MVTGFFAILASVLAITVAVILVMYIIVPLFKGIGWIIRHVARFVGGMLGDAMRVVGAILTTLVLAPLVIGSIIIGRWSASAHYGRAIQAEVQTMGLALYRIGIGHPARFLCLNSLVDGIERRLPEVVAAAPTADRPRPGPGRSGQFEGYRIVGSLPGGGSGGKLYIAEPDAMKLAIFERAGQRGVRQVVIKAFSLSDGSSLPQIVRESRALDAAKRLGLVLEHELTNERFFYITRYVPGESLGLVTQRLHAMSGAGGLEHPQLRQALGYSADLLRTLQEYHRGGLWHKDVKPDNIIVDARSAHLVDFGLVTPLRSAMTLTTHGTEYFRDPELVRLALKGTKVHQVDGARFDVYGAGAVLFSMIENSFPAHGGLSQISKRCPEALRWVVRRSMTEYDKRYPSAAAMLADVEHILSASDPYAVKPFELPSMRGADAEAIESEFESETIRRTPAPVAVGDGSGEAAAAGMAAIGAAAVGAGVVGAAPADRRRPNIRVNRWWSGGYVAEGNAGAGAAPAGVVKVFPGVYVSGGVKQALQAVGFGGGEQPPSPPRTPFVRRPGAGSAKEQLERARARADAARTRARERMHHRRHASGDFKPFNPCVAVALLLFAAVILAFFVLAFSIVWKRTPVHMVFNGFADGQAPGLAYASGDLVINSAVPAPAAPAAPELHSASARVEVKNRKAPQPRVVVEGQHVNAAAPALPAGVFSPEVRLLAISDIQPPPAPIATAVERLRATGATLMGNYLGNPASGDALDSQLLLDAQAKMLRGLASLEDPGVARGLSVWLADHQVDGLVWFARGDARDSIKYYVFTPAATSDKEHTLHMGRRTAVVELLTQAGPARAGR
jgi:serine/threonine protein kinase